MQKEQYVFQTIVNDVMNKFLQGNSIDTCVIGIQILTNLTIEMNQVTYILNSSYLSVIIIILF